eukprot:TRINITY_DN3642_c3_g1_i6.p3 TRINITY_DN3642_c3_g1~~TRINITY_DN3642_c3_g1_i6.p3  ORF type:complete len:238 (+),score=6.70 TRINITY_DN3642_c3_g1_i6:63-716(+)
MAHHRKIYNCQFTGCYELCQIPSIVPQSSTNMTRVSLLIVILTVTMRSGNCEPPLIDYYELENMKIKTLQRELQTAIESESTCEFDPTDQMITWNTLMIHNDLITRNVTQLKNGTQTITESSDPRLTLVLQKHVHQMFARMNCSKFVRIWDELYRELFKHADLVDNMINTTEHGIAYKRTSQDPYTVALIKAHTAVVSNFAKLGREEVRQGHLAPEK